jgi:hypothetical protein
MPHFSRIDTAAWLAFALVVAVVVGGCSALLAVAPPSAMPPHVRAERPC